MKYFLGGENEKVYLNSKMLNRHGIIAGATGTGKTVTLKVISEMLNNDGINTFITDVKGDIMSLAENGEKNEKIDERLKKLGIDDYLVDSFPVEIFDIYKKGVPLRASVTDIGPVLLSKMLGLNDVQSGVIDVMYKIADENELKLIDFKDLKIMLKYMADFSSDISNKYGNVAKQSINAIQRTLIRFENEGAIDFFGEPSFDVDDLLMKNGEKGTANILNCTELYLNSKMYQSVVIYLLSQIFTSLEEVGDLDKLKLVLFLDEAHLIFKDLNKKMLENIVTIIKLIRSKGVGIFFITQNPKDIPEEVLSQLSNRIEHALRAYTPNEIKNVKYAADSFRKNPNFDSEKAILNLKTGEALVSTLNEDGEPSIAEITLIRPPMSKIGMIDESVFNDIVNNSDFNPKYKEPIDRESAYEILSERYIKINEEMEAEKAEKEAQKEYRTKQNQKKRNESVADKVIKRVFNAFTYQIGRTVARDIMNTIKRKK